MLSEDDLSEAVRQGIISIDQADALKGISQKRLPAGPADAKAFTSPDEEGFRFVSGFADIFLAIGAAVLLSGLGGVGLDQSMFGLVACLGITWGLSEVFATWQRRTLPSMVCAGFFVYFATAIAVQLVYGVSLQDVLEPAGTFILAAGNYERLPLITLAASFVFYVRFHLPFSLFILAFSFALSIVAYTIRTQGIVDASSFLIPTLFVTGLVIFGGVLYFDSQDRLRRTRLSDNAFWLSLVASPLIVHSIMWLTAISLLGDDINQFSQLEEIGDPLSIAVIVIFFVLMVVALIVDRRALLFSTLIYVTAVVAYLFTRTGDATEAVSFVPIIMGGGMIAVGSFWQVLRRLVFSLLPLGKMEHLLPPVRA